MSRFPVAPGKFVSEPPMARADCRSARAPRRSRPVRRGITRSPSLSRSGPPREEISRCQEWYAIGPTGCRPTAALLSQGQRISQRERNFAVTIAPAADDGLSADRCAPLRGTDDLPWRKYFFVLQRVPSEENRQAATAFI